MSDAHHSSDGYSYSHGIMHTHSVSCGTSESESVTNCCAGLHGRTRAAVEAETIRATLIRLADELSVHDFTWLRLAVDAAFRDIIFPPANEEKP